MAEITGLSLYHLDTELTALLECRAEMIAERAVGDLPPQEGELEAIDGEIQAYLAALPAKVDAVASVMAHMQSQINLACSEIARLEARRDAFRNNLKRLKQYVVDVLDRQPDPKRGTKRLAGNSATMILKGNGGLAPLVIDNESMVPDEYCLAELCMPWRLWKSIADKVLAYLLASPNEYAAGLISEEKCMNRELIRADLEQGKGIPGAHLGIRGQHVEVK